MSLNADPYAEFDDVPAPGGFPSASATPAGLNASDPYGEFADAPAPGAELSPQAAAPAPAQSQGYPIPTGWTLETVPDRNNVPVQWANAPDGGQSIRVVNGMLEVAPGSASAPAPAPADTPTQDSGTSGAVWHGVQHSIPGIDRLGAFSGTVGNEIGTALGLNKSDASFGQIYDTILHDEQAQNAADEAEHPYAYYGGEIGGGLLLGGAVTKLARAVPVVGAALQEAPAGASLLRQGTTAVRQGAALGALYGAADAAPGHVTEGAAAGALGGGVVGAAAFPLTKVAGTAVRALTRSGADPDALAAFDRQNVTPMGAQVGGPMTRAATAITKATLGGVPLSQAAQKSIADAQAARDRIAAAVGRVTDDTGAGQAAQRGVEGFIGSTKAKADRLYSAIPIAGDRPAVLTNTKQALADLNSGLSSNPELSGMIADPRLTAFQRAIEGRTDQVPTGLVDANENAVTRPVQKGGSLSWQDLKAFRSHIGEMAGQPQLGEGSAKSALRHLYAGLSADMLATAKAEGPQALQAFNRANGFYRARQARIDNVLKLITGNDGQKAPEQAFKQLQSWSKDGGDAARLGQAMRSLREGEADTVRATMFSRMGGEDFNPSTFAREWGKIDPRAKAVLFPQPSYRKDMDDIAKISAAMKRAPEFNNHSGTAHAINGVQLAEEALDGHPVKAAGIGLAQYSVGKLLASPVFARWVAAAPTKAAGAPALAHVSRLTAVAHADPAIANEVLALQQRLASAFTGAQAPIPLAAQDRKQGNIESRAQPLRPR